MQDRADAKVTALVGGIAVITLSVAMRGGWVTPGVWGRGIAVGASVASRWLHPLVHAGVLHAVVNVYVLWQLVFLRRVTVWRMAVAYLLACCCPTVVALWQLPTGGGASGTCVVGLSGVVYVLMGWEMPAVMRRWRYNAVIVVWLLVGMVAGGVAVGMHLYCYVCGVVAALIPRWR